MKKDNLEQFVQTNRAQFDQVVPDAAIWSKIEQQLPKKEIKTFTIRRVLSMAASVLLLVGIGIAIGFQIAPKTEVALATIAPEYAEVEQYYINKVNYKLAQVANYHGDPSLEKDLDELDDWLLQLQKDLQEVPAGKKQEIINAIINNYKTKLRILETLIEHSRELNEQSEENTSI